MDLERQIKIKDEFCKMIIDVSAGYDGYEESNDLKKLIDELRNYAFMALSCDDKSQIYIDSNNQELNILSEVIVKE